MGRSPAFVPSLSASAKRKPLSLKQDRKNSPKKGSPKGKAFTVSYDKENQSNAQVNQIVDDSKLFKKVLSADATFDLNESVERMALRKRVEEAVAVHLAQRSVPGTPVAPKVKDEGGYEVVQTNTQTAKIGEAIDCEDFVQRKPSKRSHTIILMLVVLAMAIWSGVRIVLLQPDNTLMKYQPYFQQGVDLFIRRLDVLTVEPDVTDEVEYIASLMPEVTTGTSADMDNNVIESTDTHITEDELVDEVVVEEVEVAHQSAPADVVDEAVEEVVAETERGVAAVEPNIASEAILPIAAPKRRAQAVLRKAFDLLRPLKRVVATIQAKFGHVLHGIAHFFRGRTK